VTNLCNITPLLVILKESEYVVSFFISVNIFKGLFKNWLFVGILVITSVLQVIMVQFGGIPMHVVEGGLNAKYWGISIAIGFGSLPVQQLINVIYRLIFKKSF